MNAAVAELENGPAVEVEAGPTAPTAEQLRRSFVETCQELRCAVALLDVAEDRGFPSYMAEDMGCAMAVLRRAVYAIEAFEDGRLP
jgi:hypothetical protein